VNASLDWVDALDNPQAIRSLFCDLSTFSEIRLYEISVNREGPVLRLRFDVPVVPAPLPKKWPDGANTTQITVAAWGLGALRLKGWTTDVCGDLSVSRIGNEMHIKIAGPTSQFKATFTCLHLERVSGYVAGGREF